MKRYAIIIILLLSAVTSINAQVQWEVGLGASVFQQERVGFSDFNKTDAGYTFNMKLTHTVWGFNIYAARELTPNWYIDFKNSTAFTNVTEDNSVKALDMVGFGAQWRPFGAGQIQPYLRVGINYMYRGYKMRYIGSEGPIDSEMNWILNSAGKDDNHSHLVPISMGGGVNMWVTDRFGIGLQAEYLLMPMSGVKNSVEGSVRLLWRFPWK